MWASRKLLLALEAYLVDVTRQGKRCLLIVDEAQNLTPRAVEELRMLSNFQFGTQALLQSFLIGQPEFRKIMQSPQMQQLRQRVIAACHIGPMDQDETQAYIEHRLKCAGSKGSPRFDAGAFEALFEASGGVPRRINAHCDRLLLAGFLSGKSEFTRADVEEVAKEIREETQSASPSAEQDGRRGLGGRQPATDGERHPGHRPVAAGSGPSTADQAARVIADLKNGQAEQR
jgi:general secretion pathway protein A